MYGGAGRYGGSMYGGGMSRFGMANSMYGGNRLGMGNRYSRFGAGGSMYGNSMYGGGGMGGSMYGNSMYGGGGGGGGAMMMPGSMLQSGASKMEMFHMFIDGFGRFAEVLEMNFEALYGSFSAIVAFFDIIGDLWRQFHWAIKAFTLYKVIRLLFVKLRDAINRVLGRDAVSPPLGDDLEASFEHFEGQVGQPKVPGGRRQAKQQQWLVPLLVIGVLVVGGPMLISKLIKRFAPDFARQLDEVDADDADDAEEGADMESFEAVALYDYQAQAPGDLEFRRGDRIVVTRRVHNDWYEGRIGPRFGIFPVPWVERQGGGESTPAAAAAAAADDDDSLMSQHFQ
jgi:peroxin-13